MAWHKSLWESHQNKCQKMARNGTSHFSLLHTICCRMINTGGRQLTSHEIKHSPNGMAMTMDIRFIKTSTKEWMCDRKEYNPRGNVLKLPCANMRFDFFYTCCCGQMGIIFTENIIRMKCQPKNVHSRGLLFFFNKGTRFGSKLVNFGCFAGRQMGELLCARNLLQLFVFHCCILSPHKIQIHAHIRVALSLFMLPMQTGLKAKNGTKV